jgi:hypothetical protein
MARAKSSGRSKTALAIEEINQGIDLLRKQVAKVEDLKSEGFPYRDAYRVRAELQIRESIRRIFGDKSPEFQAHQHYTLRTNTPTEITETLSMLNGLIAKLESKKLDLLGLSPEEPSASPPQAGTAQSAPHLALVPPAQVTVASLVQPVVPPPVTMSIPLATNVAAPASATATSPASSARPPASPQAAVAAAPPNSPPVQPASVAFAPSSAMPLPPPPTQTAAYSPSVSPAQFAPSPVQRTETSPYVSPEPDQATAPVSSPSAPIPVFPSPVLPVDPKHHPARTRAMPAAPPALESSPPAAAGPPTPVSAMPPSADAAEVAPPSNASSGTLQPDGPEPAPAAGYRPRPQETSTLAPAPMGAHLTRQAGASTRSTARKAGEPDTSRPDSTKPTPSDSGDEPDPLDFVRKICTRFHMVVRQLRLRREYRATLDVEDEFDVQDLFYALLRLEFDEISSEEWMPSYTNCASRTTFFLNRERIAIVVKKTRPGVGAREIAEQLQADSERYAARENCRTLFCFVYDPEGRIGNPRGLEMDLTSVSDRYTVELLVAPK